MFSDSLAAPGAKVTFVEHVGDLCDAPQEVKVHAIASDAWCSRGVAAEVVAKAGRPDYQPSTAAIGHVIRQPTSTMGTVYHLVTKERSPDKYHKDPETFIGNVRKAFRTLAEEVRKDQLTEIAASYLCSGMDRLHRLWVLETLHEEFKDVPVTIHLYNKHESRRWRDAGMLFAPRPEPTDITDPAIATPQETTPAPPSTAPAQITRNRAALVTDSGAMEITPDLHPLPQDLTSTEDGEDAESVGFSQGRKRTSKKKKSVNSKKNKSF